MQRKISLSPLLVSVAILVAGAACGNAGATKSETVDGVEWNITVNKVVEFNDTAVGVGTDYSYTVADTARVNALLKDVPHCGNVTIGWTVPGPEGSIWLVAYDNEPLLSEKVKVTKVSYIPSCYGGFQVAFRFPDAEKWAAITAGNIGQRLAVIVNGQLMSAPQVNTEITSGHCSVSLPEDAIHKFLPGIDIEKLR
ncbi:MAG: hypothetical protein K2L96_00955 [Muribaculaceae bacterium]|nr:hypothetical protein [Muribaculaceae bacterium]